MAHSLWIFQIRIVTITLMDQHSISPQKHSHLIPTLVEVDGPLIVPICPWRETESGQGGDGLRVPFPNPQPSGRQTALALWAPFL